MPHCRSKVIYKNALQGDKAPHGLDRRRADPGSRRGHRDVRAQPQPRAHPAARAPTRCPTWRSRPARSPARATPAPPAGSTTSSCSTCRAAASRRTVARRLVVRGFFGEILSRITIPELRERLEAADRGRARRHRRLTAPPHTETAPCPPWRSRTCTSPCAHRGRPEGDPQGRRPDRPSPARRTRSWARTGRASRRSPTRSPGHPKYEVTSGRSRSTAQDVLAMTVDERARAGLFLAMQYPVEVPGVSMANFLRSAATAVRGEAPKLRTWVKEVKRAMGDLGHRPRVRRAQRQRGLLRRREEAPRGAAARAAQAEVRGAGRDRLRPRRRRAAGGVRGRQPLPARRRRRRPADHPLHPDPAAHHARTSCTCSPAAGSSSPAGPSWPTSWRRNGYVRFTEAGAAA